MSRKKIKELVLRGGTGGMSSGRFCREYLTLLVLVLVGHVSCVIETQEEVVKALNKTILQKGSRLILNCSFTSPALADDVTTSPPIWKKDGRSFVEDAVLDDGNGKVRLILDDVEFDDSGNYTCEQQNGVLLAQEEVVVGLPPSLATNFVCAGDKLNQLNCTWDIPTTQTNLPTMYTMMINQTENEPKCIRTYGFKEWRPCPKELSTQTSCKFPPYTDYDHVKSLVHCIPLPVFHFKVVGTNPLGSQSTASMNVTSIADLIVPQPLTLMQVRAVSSSSVDVRWELPGGWSVHDWYHLNYKFRWRQEFWSDWTEVIVESGATQYHQIGNLNYSYADTFVEVAAKLYENQSPDGWSKWSNTLSAKTNMTAPGVPPSKLRFTQNEGGQGMITLSWDPLPKEQLNGILLKYVLLVKQHLQTEDPVKVEVEPTFLNYILELSPEYTYVVSIAAKNKAGMSDYSKEVTIEAKEPYKMPLPFLLLLLLAIFVFFGVCVSGVFVILKKVRASHMPEPYFLPCEKMNFTVRQPTSAERETFDELKTGSTGQREFSEDAPLFPNHSLPDAQAKFWLDQEFISDGGLLAEANPLLLNGFISDKGLRVQIPGKRSDDFKDQNSFDLSDIIQEMPLAPDMDLFAEGVSPIDSGIASGGRLSSNNESDSGLSVSSPTTIDPHFKFFQKGQMSPLHDSVENDKNGVSGGDAVVGMAACQSRLPDNHMKRNLNGIPHTEHAQKGAVGNNLNEKHRASCVKDGKTGSGKVNDNIKGAYVSSYAQQGVQASMSLDDLQEDQSYPESMASSLGYVKQAANDNNDSSDSERDIQSFYPGNNRDFHSGRRDGNHQEQNLGSGEEYHPSQMSSINYAQQGVGGFDGERDGNGNHHSVESNPSVDSRSVYQAGSDVSSLNYVTHGVDDQMNAGTNLEEDSKHSCPSYVKQSSVADNSDNNGYVADHVAQRPLNVRPQDVLPVENSVLISPGNPESSFQQVSPRHCSSLPVSSSGYVGEDCARHGPTTVDGYVPVEEAQKQSIPSSDENGYLCHSSLLPQQIETENEPPDLNTDNGHVTSWDDANSGYVSEELAQPSPSNTDTNGNKISSHLSRESSDSFQPNSPAQAGSDGTGYVGIEMAAEFIKV